MYSKEFVSPIQKDLDRFRSIIKKPLDSYNKSFDIFRTGILPAIKFEDAHSKFLKDMSPLLKVSNNYSKYFNTSLSAFDAVNKRQSRIWEQLSPALEMVNEHQKLIKRLDKLYKWNDSVIDAAKLSKFTLSVGSIFEDENIRSIDFSGLDELGPIEGSPDFDSNINITAISNAAAVGTVETPKTKLIDMTEEDFKNLIKSSMTPVGAFSIGAFIYNLYSDYVNEAAKVILEVVFAFMLTTVTGHYNTEVKNAINDTLQETKVVTDFRKVITKYVKVNPTDQVAFLRKEAFLRSGASKKAPVSLKDKISNKTVLTIVERKNNWLKVEVDSGDFSGEIGWIEESKVIKFKKMD